MIDFLVRNGRMYSSPYHDLPCWLWRFTLAVLVSLFAVLASADDLVDMMGKAFESPSPAKEVGESDPAVFSKPQDIEDATLATPETLTANQNELQATAEVVDESEILPNTPEQAKTAYEIVIKTPIQSLESKRVATILDHLQATQPQATVVLRFEPLDGDPTTAGPGSEYEACLAIARVLTGPIGGKLRSIAYVDKSLKGHAVLVAIACEKIAVQPQSEIGSAGIDEPAYDESVVVNYQQMARLRGRFPSAAVEAFLNAESQLFEVRLTDGSSQYVNQEGLDALIQTNAVLQQKRLTIPGQQAFFPGATLRELNWIDFAPDNMDAFLETLGIPKLESIASPQVIENPKALLFKIDGEVSPVAVNRCVRTLREARSNQSMNVCILDISSMGGSIEQCNRLASLLLDLKNSGIQTVAIIDGRCKGGAALVAMACDQVYAIEGTDFGGEGMIAHQPEEIYELAGLWENLSSESGKPESQFYSVLSSSLPLFEYTSRTGLVTLGTPKLMERPGMIEEWTRNAEFPEIGRVTLQEARKRGWVEGIVRQKSEIAPLLGLEKLPEPQEMSKFEEFITRIATNNSVKVALLVIGLATFTTELTAPGSIFFGFISLVSFTGYFWLQFLNGSVESLEIALFIGGLLAICIEFFVIPGFGVFGAGGGLMCLLGLVLSAQRFVIPVTSVQWNEFAWNFFTVTAAGLVSVVLLVSMSSQIANSPFFKKLELKPPAPEPTTNPASPAVNLIHQRGVTLTRCSPYGRARFAGKSYEVRIENGFIEPNQSVVVVRMDGEIAVVEEVQ